MNQKDTHGRAERWLVLLDFRVARLKFCRHRGESRPRGPTAAAGHDGPPRQRASRCERTLSEPSSATSGPKKYMCSKMQRKNLGISDSLPAGSDP